MSLESDAGSVPVIALLSKYLRSPPPTDVAQRGARVRAHRGVLGTSVRGYIAARRRRHKAG
jgi:hypothetical protein